MANQIAPVTLRHPSNAINIDDAEESGRLRNQTVKQNPNATSLIRIAKNETPLGPQTRKLLSQRQGRLSVFPPEILVGNAAAAAGRQRVAVLDRINRMVSRFRNTKRRSAEELLEDVQGEFPDLADQHAAVVFAIKLFQSQPGNEDLVSDLIKVREHLRQGTSEELFAPDFEEEEASSLLQPPSGARELVTQLATKPETTVLEVYHLVEQLFGEDQLEAGLSFLLRDLGPQVSAASSGKDLKKLKLLIDQLFYVQVLSGFQSSLKRLKERMTQDSTVRWESSPASLLKHALALTQRDLPTPQEVSSLPQNANIEIEGIGNQIYFLTTLVGHLRLLPLKIYLKQDYRPQLLGAGQLALDSLIEEENKGG